MVSNTASQEADSPEVQIEADELVISGWRYKLDEIKSTKVQRVSTAATGPILMTAIGAICLVSFQGEGGIMRAAFGAALLVAAGIWWTQKKPFYKVSLFLPDGEATAFESPSESIATQIQETIDEARASKQASS